MEPTPDRYGKNPNARDASKDGLAHVLAGLGARAVTITAVASTDSLKSRDIYREVTGIKPFPRHNPKNL